MGLGRHFICSAQRLYDASGDTTTTNESSRSSAGAPRSRVPDPRSMPADVKEYPNSYVFIVDMPGLKSEEIKVQVDEENVMVMSGVRKKEEEKETVKYVKMERRIGEFMRKFPLPENANTDEISAICQDGVLTVRVKKLPPKKTKTIQV